MGAPYGNRPRGTGQHSSVISLLCNLGFFRVPAGVPTFGPPGLGPGPAWAPPPAWPRLVGALTLLETNSLTVLERYTLTV